MERDFAYTICLLKKDLERRRPERGEGIPLDKEAAAASA